MERKEIPILFSTPMVQAILDSRKTETRRVVKFSSPDWYPISKLIVDDNQRPPYIKVQNSISNVVDRMTCPYGKPGDVLWVRESFLERGFEGNYAFKADDPTPLTDDERWKPSIHMPKAAARIWLEVTEVRCERLQEITEEGAKAEGVLYSKEVAELDNVLDDGFYFYPCNDLRDDTWGFSAKTSFYSLWRMINGIDSWEANPWVWVVKFKVLSKTGRPENL